ncbi:hypothetical protein G6F37_011354 [Rhizopus arrhizus]|nr:hypothetical protein G6F38_010592 [Rhizopus arrhizus]KAG1149730.1 hypothetical protein G6F37_011354 [Rhizopus arrhizus]
MVQGIWGPQKLDFFATRANTRLPRFWSLNPDPQAEATNAWNQRWMEIGQYLRLPWKLNCVDRAELAKPLLVAGGSETELNPNNELQDLQAMALDCMAVIRWYQEKEQNLTSIAMGYLQQSNKLNTRKNYDLQRRR